MRWCLLLGCAIADVYLIYGMYHCINFRACNEGPTAVLLRALEPLEGQEIMQRYRSIPVT
jgi:DNA-3-methyladenine glycosylase